MPELAHACRLPRRWLAFLLAPVLAAAPGLFAGSTPSAVAESVTLPPAGGRGENGPVAGPAGSGGARVLTNERSGWRSYERGFRWEGEEIAMESGAPDALYGAMYVLRLNQTKPEPILLTAESRAEGVSGASDPDYSLYLDIIFQDGTPLWGQTGNFTTGTHAWERQTVRVAPGKPIREVYVHALFRRHTGKVWFRNIRYAPLGGAAAFDWIPVAAPVAPPPSPGGGVARVSGRDGFSVALAADGRIAAHGESGPAALSGFGGFLARDALAESGFVAGDGRRTSAGEEPPFTYEIAYPSLGLRLEATWRPLAEAIRVEGRVVDTRGQDRGVTVVLALPVSAVGGVWWDDIRRARTIEPGRSYANVSRIGSGANGFLSLYPVGAVTPRQGMGFALAVPPETPRLARLGYDSAREWLYAAVDLGLSPAGRTPGEATFALDIYRFVPQWGFREAFRRYQARYPTAFERRVPKSGIWMAFADISAVREPADFGFQFHEGPAADELALSRAAGIYTFRYIEPQSYWMPMRAGQDRSSEGILAALAEKQRSPRPADVENAWATLQSGVYDAAGRYVDRAVDAPWNSGALFILNPDPSLPHEADRPTKAQINYTPGAVREAGYSGLYIDSSESWGATQNFRQEHFQTAASPLVFDTVTGRVCLLEFFSIYDFVRFAAHDLRQHEKWVMANSTPYQFPYLLPLLDVAGTETNWLPGGRWEPDADGQMSLRRTLSGTKPYLLLMNTDFERFGPYVERYFQRSLFYGILPSMFSANASENHYFQKPAWYERDRPLFKRYIPIIRRLADAGWRIIPAARADRSEVGVERYGNGESQYWTLFDFRPAGASGGAAAGPSPSGQAAGVNIGGDPVTLAIDLEEAGLGTEAAEGVSFAVTELLTDQPLPAERVGGRLIVRLRLAPEQVAAVAVRLAMSGAKTG